MDNKDHNEHVLAFYRSFPGGQIPYFYWPQSCRVWWNTIHVNERTSHEKV